MRQNLLLAFLILLSITRSGAQRQADLTKFAKNSKVADANASELKLLTQKLANKFLALANSESTLIHRQIDSVFEDYRMGVENNDLYVYPGKLTPSHLTIQYLDYLSNYGWVGETMDSSFTKTQFTALILIPVFDAIHKGEVINTICFKARPEIYTEGALKTGKNYRREEKITAIKRVDWRY